MLIATICACGPDSFLDRRGLYTDNGMTARVRLYVDWSKSDSIAPTGMTTMLFDTKGNVKEDASNNVTDKKLQLAEDTYRLLLFNLTPSEFGSLTFSNTDSYDSLRINLARLHSHQNKDWDKGVVYMQEPEPLAIATDTINITMSMVDKSNTDSTKEYPFYEYPQSIISKLTIKVRVKGLTNSASVEGSIDGMADGYYPTQWHATSTTGSHLLDSWTASRDSTNSKDGFITTTISTFGLPYNNAGNTLTLHFSLRDGKTTKTYTYNVSDLFQYSSPHILYLTLDDGPTLPDVTDNNHSSSGFDAEVNPWEDGSNTDVNF